jgi:rare lipoprotein A
MKSWFQQSKDYGSGNMVKVKRYILCMCCVVLVSACASKRPPVSQPPESRQKAYQRPYTVLGERYEPLQTHAGFVQTGIASWYGEDFHGKKTSNGEIYDMYAMTAAHKTLPLGVSVRVRNNANGNETVVRVNDRGPFVKGRVIDLSYSAAKVLGIAVAGTAPVRIEALGYLGTDTDQYTAPANYDSGNYTVQVGAFTDPENARRLSGNMTKVYGFSEVRSAWVQGEHFYRVYVGTHASLRSAEMAEQDLEAHGYPGSFVVSLD